MVVVGNSLVSARGTMHVAVQRFKQEAAGALLAALQAVLDEGVCALQSTEELQRGQERLDLYGWKQFIGM